MPSTRITSTDTSIAWSVPVVDAGQITRASDDERTRLFSWYVQATGDSAVSADFFDLIQVRLYPTQDGVVDLETSEGWIEMSTYKGVSGAQWICGSGVLLPALWGIQIVADVKAGEVMPTDGVVCGVDFRRAELS